jgi:DNA-binding response OmpR family regulator
LYNFLAGFREEGYQVTSAFDGLQGSNLQKHHFDLILLDWMPKNGLDLCKAIRKQILTHQYSFDG